MGDDERAQFLETSRVELSQSEKRAVIARMTILVPEVKNEEVILENHAFYLNVIRRCS
jgi:hypothetical protein